MKRVKKSEFSIGDKVTITLHGLRKINAIVTDVYYSDFYQKHIVETVEAVASNKSGYQLMYGNAGKLLVMREGYIDIKRRL